MWRVAGREVTVAFFAVEPEVLAQHGPVISGESNTLGLLEQQLRLIAGSAAATGFPDAAAALQRFSTVASARAGLMREAVAGIGDATGRSADAYTTVDQQTADDLARAGDQLAASSD